MDTETEKKTSERLGAAPFAHLTTPDRRTPEERAAAESKEWARRKGRGRKDWWKRYLPDPTKGQE